MTEHFIDFQTAESDLLACATYLAERIKSSDGHAEAVKEVVAHYLAKNDVDTAAQLADSVEDTFERDKLLTAVADKCAELDDDEYALQLADAIEDAGLQDDARQKIAIRKSEKLQFDRAFEILDTVDHSSYALGILAVELNKQNDENRAMETIAQIEDESIKVSALQAIALKSYERGEAEKAEKLLEAAREEAGHIEVSEEKIRNLMAIAFSYGEIKRKDKTIEILAQAQQYAEALQSGHRSTILSQLSIGFLQAGSMDLADRVLDLVSDKTIIASTLNAFSGEFYDNGESEDALETLDEAYAIIKSERDREVRDSKARFGVLSAIAVRFATFSKYEQAIEVAAENPAENERISALSQIAQTAASKGNDVAAKQALNSIDIESEKASALILLSDIKRKEEKNADAVSLLQEAYLHIEMLPQLSARASLFDQLILRFHTLGETDLARKIGRESLNSIVRILDESHRAGALANLAAVYQKAGFELDVAEKETLRTMLRRSEW